MQVSTKNKLKNFLRTFISLSYWMNGFCLGFVIWQTIKCMTKYIEKPKGTEISMKPSTNLSFPAISVCGKFGKDNNHSPSYKCSLKINNVSNRFSYEIKWDNVNKRTLL